MKEIIIRTPVGFSQVFKAGNWHQLKNTYFEVFNDFLTEWCVLRPGSVNTKELDDFLIVQRAYYNLISNRLVRDGELFIPEYIDSMPEAKEIMSGLDSLYFTVRIINAVFDSHFKRRQLGLSGLDIDPKQEENYRNFCKTFQNALLEYTCLTFITPETAPDSDSYPENTIPSVEEHEPKL